jgi:hypothetical protein
VAQEVQVYGGVDNVDNLRVYDPAFTTGGTPNYYYDPSNTKRPVMHVPNLISDPLLNLATPTTSSAGTAVNATTGSYMLNGTTYPATVASPGNLSIGGNDTATLSPGIYNNIKITAGTVTFNPGIYVLNGNTNQGLQINGGTVTGSGVMFYVTGSSYVPTSSSSTADPTYNAAPDLTTVTSSPPTGSANLASVGINGGTVNLSGLSDTGSPFNGMLIYQARLNTSTLSVGGNSDTVNLTGTVYAPWATFKLAGQGRYLAQFLIGSMQITGNGSVTVYGTGKNFGKANLVFLVE